MNLIRNIGFAALSLIVCTVYAGEESSGIVEKPYISASQTVQFTATVEAIDHATRVVTLKGPEGNSVTFTASEEARNLDQVMVGDLVDAEYVQGMTIEVMANPGVEPAAGEIAAMGRTEKGEMPGMAVMNTKVVTATVEEINIEANTFKLKGPDGEIEEFTARNPENLTKADVGDLVVITYTEAFAISVERISAE